MDGAALTLAVETATSWSAVALTRGSLVDGAVVAEWGLERGRRQQRSLLGAAAQLLRYSGCTWQDITLLAVSLGPGSFTGLRIGLAAAKGLALALALPLAGVGTLEALACAAAGAGPLCCMLDARRGQVYGACYLASPGRRPQELLAPRTWNPEELASQLQARFGSGGVRLIGNGVAAHRDSFAAQEWLGPLQDRPCAAAVGMLGATLQAEGVLRPAQELTPSYLRPSEAELTARPSTETSSA